MAQAIETYTALHAAGLAAMHAAAFPPAERWDAAAIATLLGQPGVTALGTGGGLVLLRVAADEAEVLTLAVHPAARRAGLGRALLYAAEMRARQDGARRMVLEVADGNAAARGLYAAAGYRQVARRRAYYADGQDAVVLDRAL